MSSSNKAAFQKGLLGSIAYVLKPVWPQMNSSIPGKRKNNKTTTFRLKV